MGDTAFINGVPVWAPPKEVEDEYLRGAMAREVVWSGGNAPTSCYHVGPNSPLAKAVRFLVPAVMTACEDDPCEGCYARNKSRALLVVDGAITSLALHRVTCDCGGFLTRHKPIDMWNVTLANLYACDAVLGAAIHAKLVRAVWAIMSCGFCKADEYWTLGYATRLVNEALGTAIVELDCGCGPALIEPSG